MKKDNEAKIIERLDRLVDGMDRTASGIDKLVESIPKPASRLRRAIELFVTMATIAGILSAIDTIKNWIGG
ncbi:MAG: hypothetical protein LBG76_07185 [Treponema sp.]|jgi:hypothetical protein|nr:hypothetical protein [Treponema sp.]